ncbi:hypothetical protein PORCAN_1119 [Porphyromonas crevioricanis JCM 13913]|nr:hypothetical protein PORCAN_1119 [Porphyromonas crevioricanis JCM 13913]
MFSPVSAKNVSRQHQKEEGKSLEKVPNSGIKNTSKPKQKDTKENKKIQGLSPRIL